MSYQKNAKNAQNYLCDICNFISSNKTDFNRHLATQKHEKNVNSYQIVTDSYQKTQKNVTSFQCDCGKTYKHKQNLYSHRKKCNFKNEEKICEKNNEVDKNTEIISIENETQNNEDLDYKKMFLEMMQQNKELHNTICQLIPKVGNTVVNNTNNNNTNNNNNNINISVFLNDNCKDAFSMKDFIKQIEIEVSDLLFTSKKGLVNGVSNIFIENFNKIPLIKRPLWCVDKKKKTLYIKEDEEWSEDTNNTKTKEAIKSIGVLQAKNTNKYAKTNPDWLESEKKKDIYIDIIKETTSDITPKIEKILGNLIDKVHLSDETKDIMTCN